MIDLEHLKKRVTSQRVDLIKQYQSRLSPMRATDKSAESFMNETTKKAAVILLLYVKNNSIHFVLTQRQEYKGTHGGQISLPGGKLESSDQTLLDCAIRETHEEIGVLLNKKDIYRTMTSIYIPPSNFYVQPYLAIIDFEPKFKAEEREVKEILKVSLTELSLKNIKRGQVTIVENNKIAAPYYDLNNKIVWGATAAVLAELHALIEN